MVELRRSCVKFLVDEGIKKCKIYYEPLMCEKTFFNIKNELKESSNALSPRLELKKLAKEFVLTYKENIFNANSGFRRVWEEGIPEEFKSRISQHLVYNIMKEERLLIPRYKSSGYSSYTGDTGTEPNNYIYYNFFADKPFLKLYTDVSQFKVKLTSRQEVTVFLSPIYDTFNNEVLSFHIGIDATAENAVGKPFNDLMKTYNKEINSLKEQGETLIFHSDQGCQYKSHLCQNLLANNGFIQSMSEKGNCNQNACMESFFGRFKDILNVGKLFKFKSLEGLIKTIKATVYYWNYFKTVKRLKTTPIRVKKDYYKANNLGKVKMSPLMKECKAHYEEIMELSKNRKTKNIIIP